MCRWDEIQKNEGWCHGIMCSWKPMWTFRYCFDEHWRSWIQFFQLAALFLCVPAQLLISQVDYFIKKIPTSPLPVHGQHGGQQNICNQPAGWTVDSHQVESENGIETENLLRESWLRVESWKSWCNRLLNLKMRDIMVGLPFPSWPILDHRLIYSIFSWTRLD